MVLKNKTCLVAFWLVWVLVFSLAFVFGLVYSNRIISPLLQSSETNLQILQLNEQFPPGGSIGLWTQITFGIEGYDSEFWGEDSF